MYSCLSPCHESISGWGGIACSIRLHPFAASALDGGEWPSCAGCFTNAGKNVPYPLNWRLGGPQGRSGRWEEQEDSLSLTRIRPRYRPVSNLLMVTTLFRNASKQTNKTKTKRSKQAKYIFTNLCHMHITDETGPWNKVPHFLQPPSLSVFLNTRH